MILGFSGLRITVIAFFYLTVSISGKVISLAMLFSSSLSWLILFFSNLLTKIQYSHHISLFPSGALNSFFLILAVSEGCPGSTKAGSSASLLSVLRFQRISLR